jgi:hypothetical protein
VLRHLSGSEKRKRGLCCKEKNDTSIAEFRLDAYVEEAVIDWFTDTAKARSALIPADDKVKEQAAAAQKLINAFEEQLRDARAQAEEYDAEAGRFKLTAASLAGMEARLVPQLEAAKEKLRTYTGVSPLVLRLLEADDPDLVWNGRPAAEGRLAEDGLTLDQKREVIRKIVTVRLFKARASGRRPLDDDRIRLSFFGEPGFRAQRLRAPEVAPAGVPRQGVASGTG